jgi:hypothetical protein
MIYVILRFGIIVEYQLQVRDVFPIRLETRCPMGAKPSVEIQHLRTFDDDGPALRLTAAANRSVAAIWSKLRSLYRAEILCFSRSFALRFRCPG